MQPQVRFQSIFASTLLASAAFLAAPRSAPADVVFSVDTVITGSTPSGSSPWLIATFSDSGPNQVTLTLFNLLPVGSQFASDFFFNVNPTVGALAIAHTGGQAPDSISHYSQGAYGNPSFGNDYDVRIDFATANNDPNRFVGGETSVYFLSGAFLNEDSFSFFTPSNAGLQDVAAHIQGIPGGLSGRIGTGTGGNISNSHVPEPATMLVWSIIGLATLGAGARKWHGRRKTAMAE